MKLLIDTKTQRVLFAEAGKDVVDFLFSLLTFADGSGRQADDRAGVRGRQRVQPLRQHREAALRPRPPAAPCSACRRRRRLSSQRPSTDAVTTTQTATSTWPA
ncbi:hypothetical protein PR202_gb26407 [Eleusine coracana subsp. coracana]|uniref:Uncharacterized protein n=1 Tax=Eleusine coracana subsp. coracana TaxID=191504 RepID=A0AAV5FR33_ELECO|nr:hypothetical protein PR202_gb26407 [Eleusine coracana subsp. coracana]